MVALAVLAAAMMAIADLGGGALRNFGFARDLSGATLLARGKMAQLEEQYEDQGFRDFDETAEGDFAEEGAPGVRWKAEVLKPATDLSAEQLLAVFLGSSPDDPDTQQMLAKLLGGAAAGGQASGQPTQASAGAPGGVLGGVMQAQMTAFAEVLKKSLRELRLTVTWRDGKRDQGFSVTTHLVVLNPRAPGGARGPNPDIPPNLGAPGQPGQAAGSLPVPPGGAGLPGLAPGGLRPARRSLPQEDGSPPIIRRRRGAGQGGE
jgi:general secretion pathway protein I